MFLNSKVYEWNIPYFKGTQVPEIDPFPSTSSPTTSAVIREIYTRPLPLLTLSLYHPMVSWILHILSGSLNVAYSSHEENTNISLRSSEQLECKMGQASNSADTLGFVFVYVFTDFNMANHHQTTIWENMFGTCSKHFKQIQDHESNTGESVAYYAHPREVSPSTNNKVHFPLASP